MELPSRLLTMEIAQAHYFQWKSSKSIRGCFRSQRRYCLRFDPAAIETWRAYKALHTYKNQRTHVTLPGKFRNKLLAMAMLHPNWKDDWTCP